VTQGIKVYEFVSGQGLKLLNEKEADALITQLDRNHDNIIAWPEFVRLFHLLTVGNPLMRSCLNLAVLQRLCDRGRLIAGVLKRFRSLNPLSKQLESLFVP
jgi:5,10-methylenetetrahydrofolate reductase